jgi:1,4-dihydroxy-2-naphthoyl-CoA synthase
LQGWDDGSSLSVESYGFRGIEEEEIFMNMVEQVLEDEIHTRPDRKNALNTELLMAFYRALLGTRDKKISIVVIRGSQKSFCNGGDISEFRKIAI